MTELAARDVGTRTSLGQANARIEHDKALARVVVRVMKGDTGLFKQFSDNPEFKRWLADTIFGMTYEQARS